MKISNAYNSHSEDGFTIVEILVAVSVVAMVMTAVVSGVSFSIKNTRFANEKSVAIRYAQEALERMRLVRDEIGFAGLAEMVNQDGNPSNYCFPSLPENASEFEALSGSGCAPNGNEIPGTIYTRSVEVSVVGNTLELVSRVDWVESSGVRSSIQRLTFYNWER